MNQTEQEPNNVVTLKPLIRIKLRAVVETQRFHMVGGQPQLAGLFFVDALDAVAEDPAQEFSTGYQAKRLAKEVAGWFQDFTKRCDLIRKQFGELESVRLGKEKFTATGAALAEIEKRLALLAAHPEQDGWAVDERNVDAVKSFQAALDEAMDTDMEFKRLNAPLKFRPSRTVNGKVVETNVRPALVALLVDAGVVEVAEQ